MAESTVYDTSKVPTPIPSTTSALDAAHQTLKEIREEQIHDLDTALKKLAEERRRFYICALYRIDNAFPMNS